ncbi:MULTISPECIES: RNA-guided endonuclease InsQ/TnpB family protein [Giesbergeria]|uniref:RNA-guided endonuclease InsQ/TnpB family protein n=1 Tax=Giesbergeria sinuosa TaxID=80883 RepID=A0ABV9Q908_9BURK
MQRLQAFKFELMPNSAQQRDMCRFAGARRFVYNKALALQKANYAAGGKFISYVEMANQLPQRKDELPWLRQSPSQTLQQALKDAERAFKNFFEKRAGFPRFKHKGRAESFRFPQGFEIDLGNRRIKLPKLGWVRFRPSRKLLGTAKNITVSHSAGKWFASIQTEREVAPPVPTATTAIGIDLGIARFATFSDGAFLAPLNSFKRHQVRLARYQRRMARKVKFSSHWKKEKAKVQKIHTRIANCRKDFLHKATTAISQNHALVCIEDLQVKNMSKSAQGCQDKPGKNVQAKSGLNRSILDQGWSEFRRQLEYKLQWSGGMLVAVLPQNTSRTCPACAHVSKDNRRTQAPFLCVACGYQNHADVVGAMNVLERGLRLLACGEDVSRAKVARPKRAASVKQEPTEATSTNTMLVTGAVGIPCL